MISRPTLLRASTSFCKFGPRLKNPPSATPLNPQFFNPMRDASNHRTRHRLDTIRRIRSCPVDLSRVSQFLSTHEDTLVRRVYFERLLDTLVENDVYISVMHDLMEEREWMRLSAEYSTPIEVPAHRKMRERVENFTDAFIALCDCARKEDFSSLLEYVDKHVLLAQSKNVKHVLLTLIELDQEKTLMHFVRKIKASHVHCDYYLIYFVSMIVRYRIHEDYSRVATDFILSFVQDLVMNKSPHFIVSSQLLLYLCCFRAEVEKKARNFIKRLFEQEYVKYMNKMVIGVFCDMFHYKHPGFFDTLDADVLFFFPLDPPVIPRIKIRLEESYVHWKSGECADSGSLCNE